MPGQLCLCVWLCVGFCLSICLSVMCFDLSEHVNIHKSQNLRVYVLPFLMVWDVFLVCLFDSAGGGGRADDCPARRLHRGASSLRVPAMAASRSLGQRLSRTFPSLGPWEVRRRVPDVVRDVSGHRI